MLGMSAIDRRSFWASRGSFLCILMNVAVRAQHEIRPRGFLIMSLITIRDSLFVIRSSEKGSAERRQKKPAIDIITKGRSEWLIQESRIGPNILSDDIKFLDDGQFVSFCEAFRRLHILLILHDRYRRSLEHVIKLNFLPPSGDEHEAGRRRRNSTAKAK